MTLKLTDRSFDDYRNVSISFQIGHFNSKSLLNEDVLVIKYKSSVDVDGEDIQFMNAMKMAAAYLWRPSAIILDFQELAYKWGDTMDFLFQNPYPKPSTQVEKIFLGEIEKPFPIYAVISSLNRKGLYSLIKTEFLKDPSQVLFETLEGACKALQETLINSYGNQ